MWGHMHAYCIFIGKKVDVQGNGEFKKKNLKLEHDKA